MAHSFKFMVTVELERSEGKFASRDEMAEQLESALIEADPGSLDGMGAEGTSCYDVVNWEVAGG